VFTNPVVGVGMASADESAMMGMSTLADYLALGCTDYSGSLGIQKMPEGYALLLDPDGAYFTWVHIASGAESCIHWNKWAIWRGAHKHATGETK
jgi:hypothetical protein